MQTISPKRLTEIKLAVADTYRIAREHEGQHVGERVCELGELLLLADNAVGGLTDEELPIASHYLYRRVMMAIQRLEGR
jgi:hypothetical protein